MNDNEKILGAQNQNRQRHYPFSEDPEVDGDTNEGGSTSFEEKN